MVQLSFVDLLENQSEQLLFDAGSAKMQDQWEQHDDTMRQWVKTVTALREWRDALNGWF